MEERGLVIIGGGPAGYVAAIRAAQLGGRATIIEMDALGGTCLNRGCVPSKTLLHSAELYETMQKSDQFGITAKEVSADLAKMQACKNTVIKTHVSGVESLLNGNKVEIIKGQARLLPSRQVEIQSGDGQKQVIQAQKSFQVHPVVHRYLIGAIPYFDLVGLHVFFRIYVNASPGNNQLLADVQTGAVHVIEAHNLPDVSVMPTSQQPKRVTPLDTVTKRL